MELRVHLDSGDAIAVMWALLLPALSQRCGTLVIFTVHIFLQILNPGIEGNLEHKTSALYSGKDSEAVKRCQRRSYEGLKLLIFYIGK